MFLFSRARALPSLSDFSSHPFENAAIIHTASGSAGVKEASSKAMTGRRRSSSPASPWRSKWAATRTAEAALPKRTFFCRADLRSEGARRGKTGGRG